LERVCWTLALPETASAAEFWSAPAKRSDDGAFERAKGLRVTVIQCAYESGVALHLPPQSKTRPDSQRFMVPMCVHCWKSKFPRTRWETLNLQPSTSNVQGPAFGFLFEVGCSMLNFQCSQGFRGRPVVTSASRRRVTHRKRQETKKRTGPPAPERMARAGQPQTASAPVTVLNPPWFTAKGLMRGNILAVGRGVPILPVKRFAHALQAAPSRVGNLTGRAG